jgi:hypothetical protein
LELAGSTYSLDSREQQVDVKFMHKMRTESRSSQNEATEREWTTNWNCGHQDKRRDIQFQQSVAHLGLFFFHSQLLKDAAMVADRKSL